MTDHQADETTPPRKRIAVAVSLNSPHHSDSIQTRTLPVLPLGIPGPWCHRAVWFAFSSTASKEYTESAYYPVDGAAASEHLHESSGNKSTT